MGEPETGWILGLLAAFAGGALAAIAYDCARYTRLVAIRAACTAAWWGGYCHHVVEAARRRKKPAVVVEDLDVVEVEVPPLDVRNILKQ